MCSRMSDGRAGMRETLTPAFEAVHGHRFFEMVIEDDACLCFMESDAVQPGQVLIVLLLLFRLSLCQDGLKEVLELQKTAPFTPKHHEA